MLPEIEADHEFTIHIISSTLGSVVCFLISFVLLVDVARVRYQIPLKSPTHNHTGSQSTKMRAYTLALSYFASTTIASGSYSFIRTNTFTRIQSSQFTPTQCMIGYLGAYLPYYLSLALLYVTFVWRVDTSFRNSTYSISRWILNAFYVMIPVIVTILCFNSIVPLFVVEWMVYTHKSSNISMCVNGAAFPKAISTAVGIISGFQSVFMFSISLVLLWMFISGLWRVNKGLIRSFIADVDRINGASSYNAAAFNKQDEAIEVTQSGLSGQSGISRQSVIEMDGDTPSSPPLPEDGDTDNNTAGDVAEGDGLNGVDQTPKQMVTRTVSDLKDGDRLSVRKSTSRSMRMWSRGELGMRSSSTHSQVDLVGAGRGNSDFTVTPQAMTMIMEHCTNESIRTAAQRRATIKKSTAHFEGGGAV